MNTHEGYSKKKLSNDNVLLAGGGEKSLTDFLGGIRISSSKIQYKAADSAASWTDLITLINTDENVKQTPKTDNANRPLMMINGGTSTGTLTSTSLFSTGIYANASTKMITANGFVKTDSDSSHVLLGDGGHITYGNNNGNIPISNGTLCVNLNANYLNGYSSTNFVLQSERPTFYNENYGDLWKILNVDNTSDNWGNKWIRITTLNNNTTANYSTGKIFGYFYKHNSNHAGSLTHKIPFQVLVYYTSDDAHLWTSELASSDNIRLVKIGTKHYELQIKEGSHTGFTVIYQTHGSGITSYEGENKVEGQSGTAVNIEQIRSYGNYAYYAKRAGVWDVTRTLTIGSTGKDVNGSLDVSWSLTEIGIPAWAQNSTKPSYSWSEITNKPTSKNININGTNYAIYTSADSLPSNLKVPTSFGSANLILATNGSANGFSWVDKPVSNVSSALYVGGSGDISSNSELTTNGNVYLTLKEGSTYYKHNIVGSGRTTVKSDANGKIIIDTPTYTVNNGNLYLLANSSTVKTFTANLSGDTTLDIKTGSSNGTISVGGTNVSVKGLNNLAYLTTDDVYNENYRLTWEVYEVDNTGSSYGNKWYRLARFENTNSGNYVASKIHGYLYTHNGNYANGQTYKIPFMAIVNFTNDTGNFYYSVLGNDAKIRFVKISTRIYELQVQEGNNQAYTIFYLVIRKGSGVTTYEPNATLGTSVSDSLVITPQLLESYGNYAYKANKWASSRSFTIGNKSNNVDGTSNVSWTLTDIGIPTWAQNSTKPSYSWSEITSKPLSGDTGNNGPIWGNYVPVKSDGVMEIGKYLDFHNSSNDGVDYAVRLVCLGNNQVVINLPTSAGTLALTSQLPTVNNGNLYLLASGTTKTTFTANQSGNSTFNIATGSSNGTISVGGTDVSVKGLGTNAYIDIPHISGENLIKGSSWASTTGWSLSGWEGGISTHDATAGIYNMWSDNGWKSLYYTLPSEYASKVVSYSFDVYRVSANCTEQADYYAIGSTNSLAGSNDFKSKVINNQWVHIYGKLTLGSTPYFTISIRGTDGSGKTDYLRIRNLKVNLGEPYTIWTPSPYDITQHTHTWDSITSKPTALGSVTKPVYWNGSTFVEANSYPTKTSWNYDDKYVTFVGVTNDTTNHPNQLRYVLNGTSNYFTVPYSDTVDGYHASDFRNTIKDYTYYDVNLSNTNNWFHIGSFSNCAYFNELDIYVTGLGTSMNNTIHITYCNCAGWSFTKYIYCGESTNTTSLTKVGFWQSQGNSIKLFIYLANTYSNSYKYTGYRIHIYYNSTSFTPNTPAITNDSDVPQQQSLTYGNNIYANLKGTADNATYATTAGSVTWDNVTGKPSSFIPSSHTHPFSQITDGTCTSTASGWSHVLNNSYGGSAKAQLYMCHGEGYGVHLRGYTTSASVYLLLVYNNSGDVFSIYGDKHINVSGHIYLTGAVSNSSTSNTSQIVFGTTSSNHVVISSNTKAIVINPSTSSSTGQTIIGVDTVESTFGSNVKAPNFYTTSDRSKKQNITVFSEHIRKFQLKDTEKYAYGVIAQEVDEMFRSGEEGNMTVNYNSVLSFYIGQLENKIKELETRIKVLEDAKNS